MAQKQKVHASTQDFTEIQDIIEDVVILRNNSACLLIEVQSVNFALLSKEEQDAKLYAYASLLNSLSFALQILIRNKRVDITTYLQNLKKEIDSSKTEQLRSYIQLYHSFVQELVKVNTVLDKSFYIVIPYSPLEKGVKGAATAAGKSTSKTSALFQQAQPALHTKAEAIQNQLARVNLRAIILQKEELVKVFYDLYNRELGQVQAAESDNTPVVRGQ